jgi:L-fuculose-phosphate aldolase
MREPRDRREVYDRLIEVGADAARRGLVSASGGNLSARIPGGETFVVTGTGTWLDHLEPDDFCEIDLTTGVVVDGNHAPSSEFKLHLRTYQVRLDIRSIVHLHPQTAVLVDALGYEIRPLTLDQASYLRKINRIDFFPNASDELADAAAEASRDSNAIVMANHGCSCLGDSVPMAYRRALNLEDAAQASYRAILAGQPGLCFPPQHVPPLHGFAVV